MVNNLIKLQKKVIRFVDGARYGDHTLPIFLKYKTLKLEDIIKFSISIIMFRVTTGDAPPKIVSMFANNSSVHRYNTRQKQHLHLTFARTNVRLHTIGNEGVRTWNNLPLCIRNKISIFSFKKAVKDWLLRNY